MKFFQNLKKSEFRGYFNHGLVLQRKIKAWSRIIVASELRLRYFNTLPSANRLHAFIFLCRTSPHG